MRYRLVLALVLLAPAGVAAAEPGRGQAIPWSDFAGGLEGWTVHGGRFGRVEAVQTASGPAVTAAEIDARLADDEEVTIISEPFAVSPLTSYELSAEVRRVEGAYAFKLSIEWLDDAKKHIAYAGDWSGILVGTEWQRYVRNVISPRHARFGRAMVGVAGRNTDHNHCLVTNVRLEGRPPTGCVLSIDLIHEPIPRTDPAESALQVRLENRGDAVLSDARVQITLPEGMSSREPCAYDASGTEGLAFGEPQTQLLSLTGSPVDPDGAIGCKVTGCVDGVPVRFEQSTLPFVSTALERATPSSQLPEPIPPQTTLKLGAYYFPVMMDFHLDLHLDNRGVANLPHLRPRLGLYDEALPEVADWHIRWAVAHGISFFVYDWYGNQQVDFLSDCLDKGFLRAKRRETLEFAILWCNFWQPQEYTPFDYSSAGLQQMVHTLCKRYFSQPNYLRVDGRPVLYILMPVRIVNEHGGWEGARRALDEMRGAARQHGHPGLYLVAVQDNPYLLEFGRAGFDAATAYTFMFRDVPLDATGSAPYDALLPQYREGWAEARSRAHAQGIAYIPTAWAGWDDEGRRKEKRIRTVGQTPGAFRRMVEGLEAFVEPDTRLAHIEAWNEWGEGTTIEPGEETGFGRLSAIRDVLSQGDRGAYEVPVPTPDERDTVQTGQTADGIFEGYFRRAARRLVLPAGVNMQFESAASLWFRGGGDMRYCRLSDGKLVGESVGPNPALAGPPVMDLNGGGVAAIRLLMSVTAGREARLYYTTEDDREWTDAKCFRIAVQADGEMHEYEIDVRAAAPWRHSVIRQFRLAPTDAPARVAIEAFETRAAE